jgi:hypothetical protein
MNEDHVWSCGQCGARVVARLGAIARTFKAHLLTCPVLARQRTRAAASPRGPLSRRPRPRLRRVGPDRGSTSSLSSSS